MEELSFWVSICFGGCGCGCGGTKQTKKLIKQRTISHLSSFIYENMINKLYRLYIY